MNDDKKPSERRKVGKNKNRFKGSTNDIVALIVSFLGFVSIFYDAFSMNIDFANPIIAMIDDASGFMTFICISFIIYELINSPLFDKTMIGRLFFPFLGIVLINRLYSNSTWFDIYDFLKALDGGHVAFTISITFAFLFICYKLRKFIQQRREASQLEEDAGQEGKDEPTKPSKPNGEEKDEPSAGQKKSGYKNKSSASKKTASSKMDTIATAMISLLVAVVIFVLLDDYFVNKGNIEVVRPSILSLIPNIRYIAFVIVPAIIVAFVSFPTIKTLNSIFRLLFGKDSNNTADTLFHVTAFLALILEIVGIFILDKVDLLDVGNTFLSFLTEDVFAVLLYGSLLFLVIQIALIVFFGICFHAGLKMEIVETLEEKIQDIEKTIVKIACDLLLGCLGLFDFLPDFFKTIGLLLLGKEYEEEPDGSGAKPQGDTSTTAGTSSKKNSAPSDRENG